MTEPPGPPGPWERILGLALRSPDREAVLGDLAEEFAERARTAGAGAAARWYRSQVARSLGHALAVRFGSSERREDGMRTTLEARMQDLRYALRTLGRAPGFTAVVLLTLGLGMGSALAVFTVVDGVLLQRLPYPDPDELYSLTQERDGSSLWVSAPNYRDWREDLRSFEELAAYSPDGLNMVAEGEAVRVRSAEVTASFFPTLGLTPAVGRWFTEAEEHSGARLAVVSAGLWERRFGGGPVVGEVMTLDGTPYEVVGVAPPVPSFPAGTEVWVPIRMDSPDWRTRRGIGWVLVIGRLGRGLDPGAVRAELASVGAALREAHPDANEAMDIAMEPLAERILGSTETPLLILMAAVLLVLVVATANVGGLLAARATGRSREVGIRSALGGGRRRLLAQFLTEGLTLAVLGALVGLALAFVGVRGLVVLAPPDTPLVERVALGWRSLAFATLVVAAVATLTGLVPALQLRSRDLAARLGRGREGGSAPGGAALRKVLVSGQIAVALALVVGCGLLLRSFQELGRVDPGFDPEHVLTAGLPVVEGSFASTAERTAYFQEVVRRVDALPGVRRAALTNAVPMRNLGPTFSYGLREAPADPDARLLARYRVVTPGLFDALGMRFVEGRGFTRDEATPGGPRAAVVDETFARAHFPGRSALGEELEILDEWWTIVGVAAAVREQGIDVGPSRHVFLPLARASRQGMFLVVRTADHPAALTDAVRRTVQALDPTQPLTEPGPLSGWVRDSVAEARFTLWVLSFFGASTLVLASLGVYGILAYRVTGRTREIGVRIALGAGRGAVRASVFRDAAGLGVVGIAAGLALTWLGAPALEVLLYQVPPRDPVVVGLVTVVLALSAGLAAWIPAVRATRIAPAEALRTE